MCLKQNRLCTTNIIRAVDLKHSLMNSSVSRHELEIVINTFISSHLDYCNSLFSSLNKTSLTELQVVQDTATSLLTNSSHVTQLLTQLHWLPINLQVHFQILISTFIGLHGTATSYISELLHPQHAPEVMW